MLNVSRKGLGRRMVSLSHVVTWQLGMYFPKAIPLVFVVGFPKSGTTWACQLAAGYLQLPFPRLSLLPVGFPAVVHGHELVDQRYPYCIYVMRDGRDAMTSLYYHIRRILLQGNRRWLSSKYHSIFLDDDGPETLRRNFPRFLELQIHRPLGSRHSWGDHVRKSLEVKHAKLALFKYEDLLTDGAALLAREMAKLDGNEPNFGRAQFLVEDYSFSRRSGRKPSSEDKNSFLRKGVSGDWRNHFNREAGQIFDRFCGDSLVTAGYEQDHSWVDTLPTS